MKEQKKIRKNRNRRRQQKQWTTEKEAKKPIKRFQINHRIEIYGRRAHANDQK